MTADSVIIAPLLTEKGNLQRENRKYFFKVSMRANKIEIMKALNVLYGVNPVKCNIINVSGDPRKVRYRKGYTSQWKKAIVSLPPGETITIFEGI